jgi:DNA-binding transcriptional MerR regulator
MSYQQYEARHVKEILGISKNKLFFWVKTYGLIKPEVEQGVGTGSRNRFSKKNLLELMVIKELTSFGIDLQTIRGIKNLIDEAKVVHWEKGGEIFVNEPESPNDYEKKTVNYYEWAFSGSFDVGMNIFHDNEGKGFCFQLWEWTNHPISEEKVKNLFSNPVLVYLNVSLLARELQEKIA